MAVTLAPTPPVPMTEHPPPPTLTRAVHPLLLPPMETGAVDMKEAVAVATAAIVLEDTAATEEAMETAVATVTEGVMEDTARREVEEVMEATEGEIEAMEVTEVMILAGVVMVATPTVEATTELLLPATAIGLPFSATLVAIPLPVVAAAVATKRHLQITRLSTSATFLGVLLTASRNGILAASVPFTHEVNMHFSRLLFVYDESCERLKHRAQLSRKRLPAPAPRSTRARPTPTTRPLIPLAPAPTPVSKQTQNCFKQKKTEVRKRLKCVNAKRQLRKPEGP